MADDLIDKLDPTTHPAWYKLDRQSELIREGDVWSDGTPVTRKLVGNMILEGTDVYRRKDRPGEELGRKNDKGKARYDLVPWETMPGIGEDY